MNLSTDYSLNIYNDIISDLEDEEVNKVSLGIQGVFVKSRNLGISLRYKGKKHSSIPEAGSLTEKTALELSKFIKSWDFTKASIGLAALNSLLDPEGEEINAFDFLDEKISEDEKVGVIGYFPWAQKNKYKENVWVLERNPVQGVFPDTSCEYILPRCDYALITGSSLVNKTLTRLLELSKNAFTIVLGPTTPFSSVLFDYGADAIAGSRIKEEKKVMRMIEEGAAICELSDSLEHLIEFKPGVEK